MSENRDEQRQRQIDFIVETLARITETQAQHQTRITAAEQRDDEASERIARFERSYTAIASLLQNHDGQLVTLTDNANNVNETLAELSVNLNRLSVTVERYIAARGNGTNGTSDGSV